MKSVCAVLFLLLLAVPAQAGQVYKWTDDKGRVHYGDKPVANASKVQPKPGTQASAPPPAADAPSAECAAQREKLKTYQGADKIIEQDSLGKEREYNDDERKQLIARTERRISELCKPRPANADSAAPAESAQPQVRESPLLEDQRLR